MRRQPRLAACGLALVIGLAVLWYTSAIADAPAPVVWSEPIDITQPSTANLHHNGALVCDAYQNLHALWIDQKADAAIYYRTDASGEWSAPTDVVAVPNASSAQLRVSLCRATNTLHLVWVNSTVYGTVSYSRVALAEAARPQAWLSPRVLADVASGPDIECDDAGIVHITYALAEEDGTYTEADYIRSEDGGDTWSHPLEIRQAHYELPTLLSTALAVDGAGRIHVGLSARTYAYGMYSELGYVRSVDGGRTWSDYLQVTEEAEILPGVAWIEPYAFGEDEVHLTWHDPRRMHQWSLDGGETWSPPEEIFPLPAAFGGANELVADSAGTLHAVVATRDGVYVGEHANGQWQAFARVDGRGFDPHLQDLAVCRGNELHVVYNDNTNRQTVWYATASLDAPSIPRQGLPPATAQTISASAAAASGTPALEAATATPPAEWQLAAGAGADLPRTSGLPPVAVGAATAAIVVAAAVRIRSKR